jgi:NAD(P)-dependent dehydrogenase (short-subunit alcohol dehydrogenase family)
MWTANDIARQDGRRIIVTGGASGIGYVMPGGIIQSWHAPAMAPLPARALDKERREALGRRSEELTSVHFDVPAITTCASGKAG